MNKLLTLIKESVNNLTPIPKYFLSIVIVSNLPFIRDILILPGLVSIPWYPWSLLTNPLVSEILNLPLGILFILFSLKYFENVWGTTELLKFSIIQAAASQSLLIIFIFMSSFFMGSQLLFTPIYGFTSVSFGYLVAYKQLVPEHRLLIGGVISFRTKVLPMLALSVLFLIVTFFGIVESDPYPNYYFCLVKYLQAWSGILGSWGYLRFYQRRDGIQGDRSETFSILSFFPENSHKWLSPISNSVFDVAVRMKIISGISRYAPLDDTQESDVVESRANLDPPELFSEEVDAERRRALGLKALETRLSKK